MTGAFVPSLAATAGMEIEFQLVDSRSFELVDRVLPLLEFFPDNRHVKSEMIQNTVEVASEPCRDVGSLLRNVRGLVGAVVERAKTLNVRLCGAGTHPFSKRLALITPLPRYLAMEQAFGLMSHDQITFATHVHVGVSSGEEAVQLMSDLKPYLPFLIALSANSPYWRGYETGYAAYRQRILASSRTYGMPPDFEDWEAFERFLETSIRAGMFESIHDIHWDIRPRPHLGTLEVRVMDAQPTVTEAVALAAFIRALVSFLQETRVDNRDSRPCRALPWWAQKDNCFNASRGAMDAPLIIDRSGDTRVLRDVLAETLDIVGEYAHDDVERRLIKGLFAVIARPAYQRQIDIGRAESLDNVVGALADALSAEVDNATVS